jgi:thiol-disulfide isomerase/thioredoxin
VEGGNVRLSDLRGKAVLLNFWATWCPYCVRELPDLDVVASGFTGDVVVLGINVGEEPARVRAFLGENPVGFPVLLDVKTAAAKLYGVKGLPTNVFIDPKGRLVAAIPGALDRDTLVSLLQHVLGR